MDALKTCEPSQLLTARKSRPSGVNIECARHNIRPERGGVKLRVARTLHMCTSISRVRNKVHDQAQADDIPLPSILILVHQKKILLYNRGMAAAKVHGCGVYP